MLVGRPGRVAPQPALAAAMPVVCPVPCLEQHRLGRRLLRRRKQGSMLCKGAAIGSGGSPPISPLLLLLVLVLMLLLLLLLQLLLLLSLLGPLPLYFPRVSNTALLPHLLCRLVQLMLMHLLRLVLLELSLQLMLGRLQHHVHIHSTSSQT